MPCQFMPWVVPVGEDLAAHGHWCAFTDLYHAMPYHAHLKLRESPAPVPYHTIRMPYPFGGWHHTNDHGWLFKRSPRFTDGIYQEAGLFLTTMPYPLHGGVRRS